MKKLIKPMAQTAFVFGLLGWVYIVAMQIARLESAYWNLAWWLPLRLDYFGEICFIASAIGFLVWRMKSEKA